MAAKFEYQVLDPVLELENVSLELSGRLILRDINQTIHNIRRPNMQQGQVVAILGPSGVGKTMLAEIMAGLREATTGQVLLNKEKIPVVRGKVGFVFQTYDLLDWRKVRGNLFLAARQKKSALAKGWWRKPFASTGNFLQTRQDARAKSEEILKRFGLEDKAELFPTQLSGGQKQRVAIAQQLLCSEHFIVMDEPFSGLDPNMVEKVSELIQEVALMDELNTMIVITHDVAAAVGVADTLWLMGHEHNTDGSIKPGATIIRTHNLIEEGLAWQPGIVNMPECARYISDLKKEFMTLV